MNHKHLQLIVRRLPDDWAPYGSTPRDGGDGQSWGSDCSQGCRFFLPLAGPLGNDWGACGNPLSHRAGLLTFEHQGCGKFERPGDS